MCRHGHDGCHRKEAFFIHHFYSLILINGGGEDEIIQFIKDECNEYWMEEHEHLVRSLDPQTLVCCAKMREQNQVNMVLDEMAKNGVVIDGENNFVCKQDDVLCEEYRCFQ